jgi:hypothetical protein
VLKPVSLPVLFLRVGTGDGWLEAETSCLAVRELTDTVESKAGDKVARRKSAEYKSSFCRLNNTGLKYRIIR